MMGGSDFLISYVKEQPGFSVLNERINILTDKVNELVDACNSLKTELEKERKERKLLELKYNIYTPAPRPV